MKNRIVRTLSIGVLSAGAALTSSLAVGAERGFYVGGYYGQTKTSLDITRFDEIAQAIYSSGGFDVFSSTSTLDDETASYGFFGGYTRKNGAWLPAEGLVRFASSTARQKLGSHNRMSTRLFVAQRGLADVIHYE